MDENSPSTFDGEQRRGGWLVYGPDDQPLSKAIDVLPIAPGGFGWGAEADEAKILQLAVAILTEKFSKYRALDHHHTFATWLATEIGDADDWSIPTSAITSRTYSEVDDPDFENRAPDPGDVDLETADPQEVSFAELVALARAHGLNEFDDEERLRSTLVDIKDGETDATGGASAEHTQESGGDDDGEAAGDEETPTSAASGGESDSNGGATDRDAGGGGDDSRDGHATAPSGGAGSADGDASPGGSPSAARRGEDPTSPTHDRATPPAETASVTRRGAFDMIDIPGGAAEAVAIDYETGPTPRVMIRTPQGAALDALPEPGDSDHVVVSVQLADAVVPADRTVLGPDDQRPAEGVPATEATATIESADEFEWVTSDD